MRTLAVLIVLATAVRAPGEASPGLASTPPMGWNGYNRWGRDVTESIVKANALALVSSGMKDEGYEYVNLDGGWNLLSRDASGDLQPDPAKFPSGIDALADYVHGLGLKLGIYASAGTTNAAGTSEGSYRHYRRDTGLFASWEVDYIKLDFARMDRPYADYPTLSERQVARKLATRFAEAVAATGRPMILDLNDASRVRNHDQVWRWGRKVGGQVWRVTRDIRDTYRSTVDHILGTASGDSYDLELGRYAGPGGWNDPDMLEIGNGGQTATEYRSQFSLWAMMAAPLIAGTDLTTMTDEIREILTNDAVIAIDQDPLGKQGHAVAGRSSHRWVIVRRLADGSRAVALFNQRGTPATITTTAMKIGMPAASSYTLHDLWTDTVTTTTGAISAPVGGHALVLYRVSTY